MRPSSFLLRVLTTRVLKRKFKTSSGLQQVAISPAEQPRPLAGKSCLITGASRGIGAAIAQRFAREGARCILVGRNKQLLEYVRAGLENLEVAGEEEGHRIIVGDVGDRGVWEDIKEKNIDILVNAAGITHYSPLFVTSISLMEEVLRTNLMGTIIGCKTIGKNMLVRGGALAERVRDLKNI